MWVIFTISAAFFQTFRNIFSKQVSERFSSNIASLSRFLFGLPISGAFVLVLTLSGAEFKIEPVPFFISCTAMAFFQLLANLMLISLFKKQNFAISLTLIKTEAIILAFLGMFMLREYPRITGWAGIVIASSGLIFASMKNGRLKDLKSLSSLLALGAGTSLALCSIALKKAYLYISSDSGMYRTALTLMVIMSIQTVISFLFIKRKEWKELPALIKAPGRPALIGIFAALGSFSWFSAFGLQIAAYVRTLGQVEFIFGLIASLLLFRESIRPRQIGGMIAVAAGTALLFI